MTKKKEDNREKKENKKEEANKEQELEDILKRVQAEFVNYKKRTEEEKIKLFKMASKDMIIKVLPVLDNLERAINHTPEELKDSDWVKGLGHIKSQFENILKEEGLEIIETVGRDFDYNIHEVVSFEEDKKKKEGEILKEFQRGYKLNDTVIRPAKVIINKKGDK